ncbi:antitoxin VbhA family protein [Phascolarctobacterium sp.]
MTITEAESKERLQAWEYAKASCQLENCPIPAETDAIIQKHIAGEISAEELDDLIMGSLFDHAVD